MRERVVLITGASSGIGRAAALAFARRGARLGLVARSAARLAEVVSACGGLALALPADVGAPGAVAAAVARLTAAWGPPDVLVNCAAVLHPRPIRCLDCEEFAEMIRTNYLGTVHAVKAVLPAMLERGAGSIVNVSSLAGKVPARSYAGYAASKFAVTAFTEVLRLEVGHRGIHVCGVYPGPVATPMIRDEHGGKRVDDFPFLPVYRPEQVAEAIVRAVARRQRDVYLPHLRGRLLGALYALFPGLAGAAGARLPIRQNQVD